jgi:hypothetical protein
VRLRLGEHAVWMTSARWSWLPGALVRTSWSVESSLRWEPRRGLAIGAEGRRQVAATEAALQLFVYF